MNDRYWSVVERLQVGGKARRQLSVPTMCKASFLRYDDVMLHKRDLAGTIEVDGQAYEWELQREPQWCTADGWRGMTVAVRLVGAQREAILEFPMPMRTTNGSPQRQRPKVNDTVAINGVRAALAAGWEPTSRGKPVTFMVDANGC